METKEQIQSEMYHSFITEMSMYMSPKVHIYPKVSKSTYISKSNQKYMCLHNYPSHIDMYPKLSKTHVHVSEMSMYMSPKVHVSKTVQATCTYIEMYIYHKTHQNSSFLLFFLEGDPVGTTIGPVCISGSCKLNINC